MSKDKIGELKEYPFFDGKACEIIQEILEDHEQRIRDIEIANRPYK